jgi:hypothetical protein
VSRAGVILELAPWRADQAVTHATFQPCAADRPMALRSAASTSRTKNMQEVGGGKGGGGEGSGREGRGREGRGKGEGGK